MKKIKVAVACLVLAIAAGCASGPKYAEVKSSIPGLKPDQGRIVFYRSGTMFGAGIQPSVLLNGAKVGESKPGGFFFIDQAPGAKEVVLSTEVERKATFSLDANQVRYVRMSVGLGVIVYRVYPELVDAATGEKEVEGLSYTGDQIKSK